jgi:hypothetical protein
MLAPKRSASRAGQRKLEFPCKTIDRGKGLPASQNCSFIKLSHIPHASCFPVCIWERSARRYAHVKGCYNSN